MALDDVRALYALLACYEFLSSVEGISEAALWIHRMLEGMKGRPEHLFAFDELAAAAITHKDLARMEKGSWRVKSINDDCIHIVPSAEGNVYKARLTNIEAAKKRLQILWEKPFPREQGSMRERESISAKELLKTFTVTWGPMGF
jgi:hypothetical protein